MSFYESIFLRWVVTTPKSKMFAEQVAIQTTLKLRKFDDNNKENNEEGSTLYASI